MDDKKVSTIKAEDMTTSSVDDLQLQYHDLEERIKSLERLLMCIIDKIELDYPGITI